MNRPAIRRLHSERKAAECREATDNAVASFSPAPVAAKPPAKKAAKKPVAAVKKPRGKPTK